MACDRKVVHSNLVLALEAVKFYIFGAIPNNSYETIPYMRHWCLTHGICDVSKAALVDGIVVRTKCRVISNLNLRKNEYPTEWKAPRTFASFFIVSKDP